MFIAEKLIVAVVWCGILLAVSGVEVPSGYHIQENPGGVVFSDDFSQDTKKWFHSRQSKGATIQRLSGVGSNGSWGLAHERTDKQCATAISSYRFVGKPGESYRASVMCKFEALQTDLTPGKKFRLQIIYVDHYDKDNKWIPGRGTTITISGQPDQEWQKVSCEFPIPSGAVRSSVSLFFKSSDQSVGRAYFDDFVLEKCGDQPGIINPVMPKQFVLDSSGKLLFAIHDYAGRDEKNLLMRIKFNGRSLESPISRSMAEFQLEIPVPGHYPCTVWLLDKKNKQVIGSDRFTYAVLDGAPLPRGAAVVARDGSLNVDGKKFLPVGIFCGYEHFLNAEEIFSRISAGGFNCVLPYCALRMRLHSKEPMCKTESVMKCLDFLQKKKLKVIMGMHELIPGRTRKFNHVTGSLAAGAHAARELGGHPALLAWYISDENAPGDIPKIKALRKLVSSGDPRHPVITLTDKPYDHYLFGQTGDILMSDCYPIKGRESRSMASIRRHFTSGRQNAKLGQWFAPQAFHWGIARQPWEKYRYPTADEMRSMVLLAMNCGAKGYVFYAYHSIWGKQSKTVPGDANKFWADVTGTARILRELEPWFFTPERQTLTVKNSGDNHVEAVCYRAPEGIRVIVTADGPGKADASFRIPGDPELKSKFGFSKREADGSWRFDGRDIASDILMH